MSHHIGYHTKEKIMEDHDMKLHHNIKCTNGEIMQLIET